MFHRTPLLDLPVPPFLARAKQDNDIVRLAYFAGVVASLKRAAMAQSFEMTEAVFAKVAADGYVDEAKELRDHMLQARELVGDALRKAGGSLEIEVTVVSVECNDPGCECRK